VRCDSRDFLGSRFDDARGGHASDHASTGGGAARMSASASIRAPASIEALSARQDQPAPSTPPAGWRARSAPASIRIATTRPTGDTEAVPALPRGAEAAALAALPIGTAARLALHLPAAQRRDVRDRVLIELRGRLCGDLPRTRAAKVLAAALQSPRQHPHVADLAHLVLELNNGRTLKPRQIGDLLSGWRGW
jgi:hypothetical protein